MFVSYLDATFSLISVPLALPGVDCWQRRLGTGDAPGDDLLWLTSLCLIPDEVDGLHAS
jgi:hypothetical protein